MPSGPLFTRRLASSSPHAVTPALRRARRTAWRVAAGRRLRGLSTSGRAQARRPPRTLAASGRRRWPRAEVAGKVASRRGRVGYARQRRAGRNVGCRFATEVLGVLVRPQPTISASPSGQTSTHRVGAVLELEVDRPLWGGVRSAPPTTNRWPALSESPGPPTQRSVQRPGAPPSPPSAGRRLQQCGPGPDSRARRTHGPCHRRVRRSRLR